MRRWRTITKYSAWWESSHVPVLGTPYEKRFCYRWRWMARLRAWRERGNWRLSGVMFGRTEAFIEPVVDGENVVPIRRRV